MAYNIQKISFVQPDTYPLYFFDSNVWIAQLQGSVNLITNSRFEPYINFFEGIINLHSVTDIKLLKKVKYKPRIVVTSLLLSEIFNGYMRQIAMRVYYEIQATKNGPKSEKEIKGYRNKFDFKKDYRKSSDYKDKLRKLKSNFLAFQDFIEYRNDDFKELDPETIVREINEESDFNDFYYYFSLAEKEIPVVTDDSDFIFQDIPIITDNSTLLKAMK